MTPQHYIAAPSYGPDIPLPEGRLTSLSGLCAQAGIPLKATAPYRPVVVRHSVEQLRMPGADVVGVPVEDVASPEAAIRALEALAHSFHDHAARACVRGLFS